MAGTGKYRYEVILYWYQEAVEAAKGWIETAKDMGRPIPEPKGRRLMHA